MRIRSVPARLSRNGATVAAAGARGVGRAVKPAVQRSRFILAFKAALAAAIAWTLGHMLPEVDEYSYYAPLGAMIAMTPTLMGSVRSSLQTLGGLGLGILLAWAVALSPLPGWASVGLAVGLGFLLAGVAGLGTGREYVPIAALFVLVIGGANPDEFSLGYLVQMGLGMAVGTVVNLAILPPLLLQESADSIMTLRSRLAAVLREVSVAIKSETTPSDDTFRELHEQLRALQKDVRASVPVVDEAAESRRLNVRARRHPYDIDEDFEDLATLDRLTSYVHTMFDDVEDLRTATQGPDAGTLDLISLVFDEVADAIELWNSPETGEPAAKDASECSPLATARDATDRLRSYSRECVDDDVAHQVSSIATCARRVITAVDQRMRPASGASDGSTLSA